MYAKRHQFARECSPFLDQLCSRHPDWLEQLESTNRLIEDSPPGSDELDVLVADLGIDAGLRRFRNREMLRIIWRELNSEATLAQTMADLSYLADLCTRAAVDYHQAQLIEKFGTPRDAEGAALSLVVLGLGKLGGYELNLSSDIDVIFCFPALGQCDGRRSLSTQEFFTRVARGVVKSLTERTGDGFVFRVDTRLRPFGESGPLVCSFGALELYYQREGRDWERYALIKARPIAGDIDAGTDLLHQLSPFVYRRYIDYGAVEALQEMLTSIREDAARISREKDIKRGPGGIREVEFLVQCLQLLRGGRTRSLQTTQLLVVLEQAEKLELFPQQRVEDIRSQYHFLRRLENAIQALHDQQTHVLPEGEDLDRVARVMGFAEQEPLLEQLAEVRHKVTETLNDSFPRPDNAPDRPVSWQTIIQQDPGLNGHAMQAFQARLDRFALSQRATSRLNSLMPLLIERIRNRSLPDDVLDDVLELVLAICRRSAYLALLVQNPHALDRMLDLFSQSGWAAATVKRYPALLDELIAPSLGQHSSSKSEMQADVARILRHQEDTEAALMALNYTRRSFSLRIAAAEIEGSLAPEAAERQLTSLAEAIIDACLTLASRSLQQHHGQLEGHGLAIIGYGTLGARTMSYASDLDLVFLYESTTSLSDGERPLAAETYWTRVTRRLMALTTSVTPAGRLYEIDARLRPNGRSGMLVSSLQAFERYQSKSAWVWELQALVRSRPISGDPLVAARFDEIRRQVLCLPRDADETRNAVIEMRDKMRKAFTDKDSFKQSPGGLVDIDFVAQLGVLVNAHAMPELVEWTNTRDQLNMLSELGWLQPADAQCLIDRHQALTHARHLHALLRKSEHKEPDLAASKEICQKFLS